MKAKSHRRHSHSSEVESTIRFCIIYNRINYEIHTGVYGSRLSRKWASSIGANGKSLYLGVFANEEAAARAYDEAAKEHRIDPILNFLPDGSPNPHRKMRLLIARQGTEDDGASGGGGKEGGGAGSGSGTSQSASTYRGKIDGRRRPVD